MPRYNLLPISLPMSQTTLKSMWIWSKAAWHQVPLAHGLNFPLPLEMNHEILFFSFSLAAHGLLNALKTKIRPTLSILHHCSPYNETWNCSFSYKLLIFSKIFLGFLGGIYLMVLHRNPNCLMDPSNLVLHDGTLSTAHRRQLLKDVTVH